VVAANLSGSALAIGWFCFVVGLIVMFVGIAIGIYLSLSKSTKDAEDVKKKVDEAKKQVDALQASAVSSSLTAAPNQEAADQAQTQAAAAKSTLDEISSIIGSLPENLRFAGLLVLVGVALMSVATVQFGGQSIF
jgi:disulfide bond formation protein DsbB